MIRPQGIQRACCFVVFGLLTAGCQDGPTSGIHIAGCPDGNVESLTVAVSGQIEHSEGTFLEWVDRKDQKLIVVDFWAPWCGPCKMLGPHLEKIKQDWGDKVEIIKVDVDQNHAIAGHLHVSSIPDVRIFRGGTQVGDFVGLMPRQEIESLLKSLQ